MATITKLLVAGRGEIARRIMRAAREMGITTIAVYADPDAAAPFVREADEAVALRGNTSPNVPRRGQADRSRPAHRRGSGPPGYGFLAENAEFARAVTDAGLIWVGPRSEAIAAMGDKIAAKKKLMAEAGCRHCPRLR